MDFQKIFASILIVVGYSFVSAVTAQEQEGLDPAQVVVDFRQENRFSPATHLSSQRLKQVIDIARDVYELKSDTRRRIINGVDFDIHSHFEAGEIPSCTAVYTTNAHQQLPSIFVVHKIGKKVFSGLENYHERLHPRVQSLLDTLDVGNVELFFIGDNTGASLAYLSAAKTARDRNDLKPNQVKAICFDEPALEASQIGGLRSHLSFGNILSFYLTTGNHKNSLGAPIETLLLERVSFGDICLSSRELLLKKEAGELIMRAYAYFQEQALLKSLTKAGSVPFLSSDRNPVIHWLKRALFG